MKISKFIISAVAIPVAMPALAFDTVTWNWDADVVSTVTTSAIASLTVAPTGLEQVESEQLSLGSFTATSTSNLIANDVISLTGLAIGDVIDVATRATALGNSGSLESDVSMQFDMNQTFGGASATLATPLTGGILDITLPGVLAASATTTGIVNGTVDSAATSVANNMTANLVTTSGSDAFLLGNSIQNAYATATSISLVDGAVFNNVSDLGTLVNPGISSVSTSLGNNLGVTIDGLN